MHAIYKPFTSRLPTRHMHNRALRLRCSGSFAFTKGPNNVTHLNTFEHRTRHIPSTTQHAPILHFSTKYTQYVHPSNFNTKYILQHNKQTYIYQQAQQQEIRQCMTPPQHGSIIVNITVVTTTQPHQHYQQTTCTKTQHAPILPSAQSIRNMRTRLPSAQNTTPTQQSAKMHAICKPVDS